MDTLDSVDHIRHQWCGHVEPPPPLFRRLQVPKYWADPMKDKKIALCNQQTCFSLK